MGLIIWYMIYHVIVICFVMLKLELRLWYSRLWCCVQRNQHCYLSAVLHIVACQKTWS